MDFKVEFSGQFRKDARRCEKRNYKIELLEIAMKLLRENGKLPFKYKPHKLSGNYSGFWEGHIKPDWLLIWELHEDTKTKNWTEPERTAICSDRSSRLIRVSIKRTFFGPFKLQNRLLSSPRAFSSLH